MNFTTKERFFLEDQKSQEEICVQKYTNYAGMASCQELKSIFQQNGQKEQEHYNTIDQFLKGQMPSVSQSGSKQSGSQQSGGQQSWQMKSGGQSSSQPGGQSSSKQSVSQQSGGQQSWQMKSGGQSFQPQQGSSGYNNSDKDLCTDMLMTEKYVSGAYDTAIFEFRDPQVRSILNHIQKEEQQHGEAIFKYMESKGMYQAK
ncbi:MAG TPA: spore coat protein [Sedimentibacter sp.]|nr:spore coat protein [Sedimentibacter sp.]HOH70249.1 spore coat protein [Sedimentibacter sp.]HQB63071.1 spore coat protein [Sedimentibacter sp.]